MLALVECPALRLRLNSHLQAAAGYLAGPEGHLDTFLTATRQLPDLEKYVIRRGDKTLINREVVKHLYEHHAYGFRETRIIDALRQRNQRSGA